LGYVGITAILVTSVIELRDVFNPLCAVLLVGLVRYSCPGFLLLAGVEPPEGAARFYKLMGLSDPDWLWGHVLALTSLSGVGLGWLAVRAQVLKRTALDFSFAPGVSHAALVGMLVGLAALVVFIVKNASLGAIVTGAMRNTTVQVGTGMYLRLSFMLIGGSILLSAFLLERNRRGAALIPVFVAALALFALGGRGRAITPVWAGLLLQWYHRREQIGWPALSLRLVHVFVFALTLVFATWLFHFGALYRGGQGLSALGQSLSPQGMWQYVQYSIFADFGSLHALAGAVAIGPGVLEGKTFFASLTWPLPKLLPIPGRSAGIYIIETLVGFPEDARWGLHASLMGDAYLNFGLPGILVIMPLFGVVIKWLYARFRAGRLNAAFYAFAVVYGVSLFLKSIDVWENILMGLFFMVLMIRLADLFDFRRRALA
jgi:oligosaccharide repeat unit polymerase